MKRLNMEEKLPWKADRNSPTLFRMVPSSSPYGLPFLDIGCFISETGKATDFKFGVYIYRANPIKSPLKFRRKLSVGVSRTAQIFFGHQYNTIQYTEGI